MILATSHDHPSIYTTGLAYFAECHRHSAKAEKHSANSLPSVALGEAYTAFLLPAKPALPSVFSRALGKLLPCAKPHSAKKVETGRTNRKTGERNGRTGRNFAETHGTRQRFKLCRVPSWQHSAKFRALPSAATLALGEVWLFAECHASGTRRSFVPFARSVRQFACSSVPFQLFLPSVA